jgi:hypothetical protein
MSRGNGSSDIPGAPGWVKHLLGRFEDIVEALRADLQLAVGEFRGLPPRVTSLEERVTRAEAEIIELRRSITPPNGIPAQSEPPDEVA